MSGASFGHRRTLSLLLEVDVQPTIVNVFTFKSTVTGFGATSIFDDFLVPSGWLRLQGSSALRRRGA